MNDALKFFPFYPNFRKCQKNTILSLDKALNSDRKFTILEAPTGTGKSPLGMTFARMMDTDFLTIQKLLQDQYLNDFQDIELLKGRNAYKCSMNPSYCCDEGALCYGKGTAKECSILNADGVLTGSTCPYRKQVFKVDEAPIRLFNFHSFLFQTTYAERFTDTRNLMIIDEAHNQEGAILGFMEFSLNDKHFNFKIPKLDSARDYAKWFIEHDVLGIIEEQIKDLDYKKKITSDSKERSNIIKIITSLERKLKTITSFIHGMEDNEYITEWEEVNKIGEMYNKITIKPICASGYADNLLYKYAKRVLMMSATILDAEVFASSLGIPEDQINFIRVPNIFPLENRPIYTQYCGPMSYRYKSNTMPHMLKKIKSLLDSRPNERGIIHTHSRDVQKAIHNTFGNGRLTYDWDFDFNEPIDKKDVLEVHGNKIGSIIVAPAWHEGVDLKDDLSRLQIIMKVPYPSLGDKRIKLRMQKSQSYYNWLTALKIVQSYGRSIRSETDHADTYILDQDFEAFRKRSRRMLPQWFTQAIQ